MLLLWRKVDINEDPCVSFWWVKNEISLRQQVMSVEKVSYWVTSLLKENIFDDKHMGMLYLLLTLWEGTKMHFI